MSVYLLIDVKRIQNGSKDSLKCQPMRVCCALSKSTVIGCELIRISSLRVQRLDIAVLLGHSSVSFSSPMSLVACVLQPVTRGLSLVSCVSRPVPLSL